METHGGSSGLLAHLADPGERAGGELGVRHPLLHSAMVGYTPGKEGYRSPLLGRWGYGLQKLLRFHRFTLVYQLQVFRFECMVSRVPVGK